jgi:hypothetical protein
MGMQVGYGPFSLCVIHKEDCPNSGDVDRLMMMIHSLKKVADTKNIFGAKLNHGIQLMHIIAYILQTLMITY